MHAHDEMHVYVALGSMVAVTVAAAAVFMVRFGVVYGFSWRKALSEALDLVTIVVPPALPATVTFVSAFMIVRLGLLGVSFMSVAAVQHSAHVNLVCLDTTGTLTEQRRAVRTVLPVEGGEFLTRVIPREDARVPNEGLRRALACCRSLAIVNGELVGDEVEHKLVETSGFALEDAQVVDNNDMDEVVDENG